MTKAASAKAAVFDLDGTLFCLPVDWEGLFARFRQIMHLDAVRPLVDTVAKLDDKTRAKVFEAWDRAELAIFDDATECGQGLQLYCAFEGKPRALVTLQGRAVISLLLKKFNLKFDVVLTREDSIFRTEQLQVATEKLHTQASDVLFVGNTESDAQAAKTVGCMFQRV